MSEAIFEGSYGGDATRISSDAKLECKICWHVYDPAVGDAYWQIPAGIAFADLPEHWSCPNCDSRKSEFMVVDET
ncbi:MAG: rubredoxin [Hyphomicrobiaceae bacterium]